jgi:hypothetical protein
MSSIDATLVGALRRAGLANALVSLDSPRVRTFLRKPGALLREGWRLAPEQGASYLIGDGRMYGQQLWFDHKNGTVRLRTFYRDHSQEILYDMVGQRVVLTSRKPTR